MILRFPNFRFAILKIDKDNKVRVSAERDIFVPKMMVLVLDKPISIRCSLVMSNIRTKLLVAINTIFAPSKLNERRRTEPSIPDSFVQHVPYCT